MPERPSLLDQRGSSRRQNVKKEFQNVKKEPHQQHQQLEQRQYTTTQKIPLERPSFPDPGGTIGAGGRFFCLGFLGKGTFCSIHKCVDLSYYHESNNSSRKKNKNGNSSSSSSNNDGKNRRRRRHRIVAAKVELAAFSNSGVLDGEANVLRHLASALPRDMVPDYIEYVKRNNGGGKGIVMEYLPGEDMHHLRDRHCQSVKKQLQKDRREHYSERYNRDPRQYRRLCTIDAVSLCTDSILRLLQNTHDAGIIHRDVKPSNVVRAGRKRNETSFRLVDFGLSKSFVVPSNSPLGESKWPWGKSWQGGGKGGDEGCFRAEREKAEFRGTSMYASLRVHQEKDYCRRDDIWGLLYVFCDLVSGGLPWMGYAAERKRDACKRMKEWVHGESSGEDNKEDHTEELLKGADYHLARHQRKAAREKEKRKKEPCPSDNPNNDSVLLDQVDDETEEDEEHWNLPPPLAMSHDVTKVNALRKAFRHVATLSFNDEPNYKLIESCLREFTIRTEITETDEIPPINWEGGVSSIQSSSRKRDRDQNAIKGNNTSSSKEETNQDLFVKKGLVQFYPHDLHNKDPLLESELVDAERERARKDVIDGKDSNNSGGNNTGSGGGVSSDLTRLPLTLAYRLAQVEYNTANPDTVPPYLAFRDWFALAAELRCMYFTWDSKKYEIGTKRTNNDKYKRELYAKLLEYCVNVGEAYKGFNMKGMLDSQRLGVIWFNEDGNKHAYDEDINNDKFIENGIKNEDSDKSSCNNEIRDNNIMTVFALVKVTLNIILVKEIAKEIAPPPELTFGVSSMKRET